MKQKTIKKLKIRKETLNNLRKLKGGDAPTFFGCATGCICPSLVGQQSCGDACTLYDCFPIEI